MSKLAQALENITNEVQAVEKSSKNPFFKSNYADLNAILDEVKPIIKKYGCYLTQPTIVRDGKTIATSKITHTETQESEVSEMIVDTLAGDMQKAGAGITYGRRFTLKAMLAMQEVDDDGNFTTGKTSKMETPVNKPTASTAPKATFAKTKTVAKDDF